MIEHRSLSDRLVAAVIEAGAIEMKHYRAGVAVEAKSDESPVTAADREAEVVLLAALARVAPDIPVVAEESAEAGRIPDFRGTCFYVDPLDGTREFINHRDEFTVNIALVENGVPVFGMVYAPALGDLYATHGERLAVQAHIPAEAPFPGAAAIDYRRIEARLPDADALVAVASRSHLTPETEAFLARFTIGARRDAGSSLKFCLMARGEADIYPRLGPTMAWDTAAGHAVLKAAGGTVVRLDGSPLTYGLSTEGSVKDRLRNPHFVAWGRAPLHPKTR